MKSVFLIEDDFEIIQMIKHTWPDRRDNISFVTTASKVRRLIFSGELDRFECVVMDVNLPDGSGLELLRDIRKKYSVPVVLISGAGSSDTRADAIASGADDYVMKPFNMRELSARVYRLIERQNPVKFKGNPPFQIGEVIFSPEINKLKKKNNEIKLTDLESRILILMNSRIGQNCTRNTISIEALFREYDPRDKTMDVYINRIRNHLDKLSPGLSSCVKTVRGVGYRLERAPLPTLNM